MRNTRQGAIGTAITAGMLSVGGFAHAGGGQEVLPSQPPPVQQQQPVQQQPVQRQQQRIAPPSAMNAPVEETGIRPDPATMRQGRRIPVNERFTRSAANNCAYEAIVSGHLQEWLPRSAGSQQSAVSDQPLGNAQDPAFQQQQQQAANTAMNDTLYEPTLSIDASLRCPQSRSLNTGTLSGRAFTSQQLEQVLEARARVLNGASPMVCALTPDFTMQQSRIRGQSLTQSCLRGAIGGGPQSQDIPTQFEPPVETPADPNQPSQ